MDISAYERELKSKTVCRFCLTQEASILHNIYGRDDKIKATAPLPLQVMAISSIEIHANDGMPTFVCSDCRIHFEYCYRFKQMCKKADTLLRQYPFVKKFPDVLEKPKFPKIFSPNAKTNEVTTPMRNQQQIFIGNPLESVLEVVPQQQALRNRTGNATNLKNNMKPKSVEITSVIEARNSPSNRAGMHKRLHNAYPSETPEPPIPPKRIKTEKADVKPGASASAAAAASILDKVDNDQLYMDDVKLLIEAAEEDEIFLLDGDRPNENNSSAESPTQLLGKPKLLNKSSVRILNKDVVQDYEPRIRTPQVKQYDDGNVEVTTAILDPNEPYDNEPDPLKNAVPVQTDKFPCDLCIRTFPLKQLLDIHMARHTRERPHHCTECSKSFFTKYDLQKHVVIHTGEKPFKCSICDKAFNRAALLHLHGKTHPDVAKFICIYCEKPFISKEELTKHMQRHLKNRPFQCKICSKKFAFKQGLERHEVIHAKDHPHHCDYCDMSFTTAGKLSRHLTAHAGKRAYPCKYCDKSFILSHHLTRHLCSHKEFVQEYSCNICKSIFRSRPEFLKHSTTHAIKSLECPICKESFQNTSEVEAHMKDHEKDGFPCMYCDLMFTENAKLRNHLTSDHSDEKKLLMMEANSNSSTSSSSRSGAKSTKPRAKVTQQSVEDYEEQIMNECLVDDDTINSENEDPTTTETIKIEPLSLEDEEEHEEHLMDKEEEAPVPIKMEKATTIPPRSTPRQTILNSAVKINRNSSSSSAVASKLTKRSSNENISSKSPGSVTAGIKVLRNEKPGGGRVLPGRAITKKEILNSRIKKIVLPNNEP